MIGQLNPALLRRRTATSSSRTNPAVKTAWDRRCRASQAGESAGLAAFSTDWNTGFKKGKFATVACPAWMMGYIQGQAPDDERQVGHRRGPRRRRQLGRLVPRHPEAVEAPAGGLRAGQVPDLARHREAVRLQADRQPAEPAGAATRPGRSRLQEPVLQQRPGRARSSPTSAQALKPQITGPHQGDIQTAATNAIQRVEQSKQSPTQSWEQFLKDAENVAPELLRRRRPRGRRTGPGTVRRPASRPSASEATGSHMSEGAVVDRRPAVAPRAPCCAAAAPARREGLAVPLRRAVLRPLRRLRALPAGLHGLGLAARLEPARSPTTHFVGLDNYRDAAPRRVLLERGRQHARHLPALDGAAAPARARPRARC